MKKKTASSKNTKAKNPQTAVVTHKLGSKRNETAKKPRQLDKNFKQSRDVREDRGVRQKKSSPKNQGK
jgi:hypothetical protein